MLAKNKGLWCSYDELSALLLHHHLCQASLQPPKKDLAL